MDDLRDIRIALERERTRRLTAESMLEEKSLELYRANHRLSELNTSLEKRNQEKTMKLEVMNTLAVDLLQQESLDDVVWTIIDNAISRFGLEDCVIYLYDETGKFLIQRAAYGAKQTSDRKILDPIRIKVGDGIVGKVAQTGNPVIISDTTDYPEYIVDDSRRYSELTVPIIANGKVIGVIDSEHSQKNFYDQEHLTTFTTIASLAATKIKNAIYREQRDKIEHKLKMQEEKYRNIIANMNLGMLEVDLEDVIQYANNSFCDISGFSRDELIGSTATELLLMEEDQEGFSTIMEKRTHGVSDFYQLRVHNKKGNLRWWLVSGAPNYNDEGVMIGSIGIHLDITLHKVLEMDLDLAKQKAEESAMAKEEFLANMSHEIRTPLNAIMGMVMELSKDDFSPGQRANLGNIQSAANHLLSIVNNILDMSKIEAGEFHLEEHPFSLRETIEQTRRILQAEANRKNIKLEISIEPTIGETYLGDASRIRQILINLLSNALKFTDKGKVSIGCTCEADFNTAHEIKLSIRDTGSGMNESYINEIFEKFSQERASRHRNAGGTGLGMAVTKKLVEMMKGMISVNSEKNAGTVVDVCITLPIGVQDYNESIPGPHPSELLSGRKILLVEDNDMNRLVATNCLTPHNMVVTEAVNGSQAVDLLQKNTYDIILMDLHMPVMDGMEATHIIRDIMDLDTPIIALTANAFKKEVEQCLSIGMTDYVTKPFEAKTLLAVILQHLCGKSSPQQLLAPDEETTTHEELYNLSKLREMSMGNESFVLKMSRLFLEQAPNELKKMKSHLAKGDLKALQYTAHKLKPSVDHMGVRAIKEDIRRLEEGAESNLSKAMLQPILDNVEKILLKVFKALKEDLAENA